MHEIQAFEGVSNKHWTWAENEGRVGSMVRGGGSFQLGMEEKDGLE